jgi:thioredoxin reductase
MPQQFRFDKVRKVLGPAPCWFTKEQVVGRIPLHVGVTVTEAKVQNGRVSLQLTDSAGTQKVLTTDHVIAATGYKVDLERLTFLSAGIRSTVKAVEGTPVLSSDFEASTPGLYFVGVAAANSFGPVMRFAFGADFAARTVARRLAKPLLQVPVSTPVRRTATSAK